ncbi:ribosomal large subunit pseudouridine synthase A [gut metagenome]|uniref:Ribosomal large subunit pseudouridine synthase A n=1 Tax=gut metagenome TaxID=749906 RepID=J9FVB5_9ZZZZ
MASKEVQDYLKQQVQWKDELAKGKMFGVLVVKDKQGNLGYLAAYSGILDGSNKHPFFVPPVYNLLDPQGFFKLEEKNISDLNRYIDRLLSAPEYLQSKQELTSLEKKAEQALRTAKDEMKESKLKRDKLRATSQSEEMNASLIRESQYQKASYKRLERDWKGRIEQCRKAVETYEKPICQAKTERKQRSALLQQRLFEQFNMLNAKGEKKNLCQIFQDKLQKTPPAGAGECAAPKLLQYAYIKGYHPIAMAEFWLGASPKAEIREHGHFYPACKRKCEPILEHMLQGLKVEPNPLKQKCQDASLQNIDIIYEDQWLVAVNKPNGMLSVPGKSNVGSVYQCMKERYPNADGPLTVHRLDMDTSGIMLIAKTKEIYQALQAAFHHHSIQKQYIAILEGTVQTDEGYIQLPLCPDIENRPCQMVNEEYGKPALTYYRVLERKGKRTRIAFYPQTGRTHQLRVHAAHIQGLHCPIAGDMLYGTPADRLYLHAASLEFTHPISHQKMHLSAPVPF